MEAGKKRRFAGISIIVAALLITVVGALAFNIPGMGKFENAKVVNGVVSVPLAKVSEKAAFFRLKDGGKEIGFFVVKGADGAVHTAFDTCDVCYKAKKGYEQSGDFMVCKNCNQRFAINKIGPHAVGGCNPSYLPSTVQGNTVVIKAGDIQSGAKYF